MNDEQFKKLIEVLEGISGNLEWIAIILVIIFILRGCR